jgi:hypothetical protein
MRYRGVLFFAALAVAAISGDEIKFNRNAADMASEDFVAKRAK